MRSIIVTCSGILLLVTPSAGAEIKVTTSCYVPSVAEGQSTSITCNFSTDISVLRRGFKVEFHANKTNETGESVLDCLWNNEVLECSTHPCCAFDMNMTNSLQVQIRNATTERVGKYICYVMPVSSGSSNFCNFNISEAGESKEAPGTGPHFGASLVAAVILSTLLVCLLVVIILVCVFCKGIRERTRTLYRSVRRFVNNSGNGQSSTSERKKKRKICKFKRSTAVKETKPNSKSSNAEERFRLVNNVSASADSPKKIEEEPPNLTESVHGNQNINSTPECQSSDLNESQGSPHTAEEQEQHSCIGAAPVLLDFVFICCQNSPCNDDSSNDTSAK